MPSPTTATVKRLFAVSGNRCAFPDCTAPLVIDGTITGEICHIKAQNPKGPRYDPGQTDKERHGFENLLLLCPSHHKVVDDNPDTYTVERLKEIKAEHEARSEGGLELGDEEAGKFIVAASGGGIGVGGDVNEAFLITGKDNIIYITYQGARAAIPSPKAVAAQRNRCAMLELVRNTWVKGVLEQSLHGAAMIELGLETRADAVEHPWDMVLQMPGQSNRLLPPGTKIVDVFDKTDGALLILGEPGSGKTTMLLELARNTIARAEEDPTQPIPVVFNLSSWAEKRHPIVEWLVEELNTKYHVPRKVAQSWVENGDLLLLLDGLDEVEAEHREACVKAINDFRHKCGLMPLAICSRIADYEALATRLELRGAVLLQPLTPQQIDQYLGRAGAELAAARETLRHDTVLQELVETPLMLSVMTLAYQGASVEDLQLGGTVEARRKHLFDRYLQRMFERRRADYPYPHEQAIHWLTWLAQQMTAHAQIVFLIEGLQFDWLPAHTRQRACRVAWLVFWLVVGLGGGLVVGLVVGLGGGLVVGLGGGLVWGLGGGLVIGLVVGLVGELVDWPASIETVETLRWSWREGVKGLAGGLVGGLGGGLVVGLIVGLVRGLVGGLVGGLGVGLFFGLVGGLVVGLSFAELETKAVPNQGIRQSAKNTLVVGLVFGLVFGMFGGLVVGMFGGLVVGLVGGLVVGLIFYGGEPVILHFILRYFLHCHNCLPWRVVPFLDYAVERIFLRKVGGGYIFVHRLVQEYFASLYEGETAAT